MEYDFEEKRGDDEEGTNDNDDEQIYCADLDEMKIAVLNGDGISGF
jgi:hypothetical protein